MACVKYLRTDFNPTADAGGLWTYLGYNASSQTGPWGADPSNPLDITAISDDWIIETDLNTDAGFYAFQYSQPVECAEPDRTIIVQVVSVDCPGGDNSIVICDNESPIDIRTYFSSESDCGAVSTWNITNVDGASGYNPVTYEFDPTVDATGQTFTFTNETVLTGAVFPISCTDCIDPTVTLTIELVDGLNAGTFNASGYIFPAWYSICGDGICTIDLWDLLQAPKDIGGEWTYPVSPENQITTMIINGVSTLVTPGDVISTTHSVTLAFDNINGEQDLMGFTYAVPGLGEICLADSENVTLMVNPKYEELIPNIEVDACTDEGSFNIWDQFGGQIETDDGSWDASATYPGYINGMSTAGYTANNPADVTDDTFDVTVAGPGNYFFAYTRQHFAESDGCSASCTTPYTEYILFNVTEAVNSGLPDTALFDDTGDTSYILSDKYLADTGFALTGGSWYVTAIPGDNYSYLTLGGTPTLINGLTLPYFMGSDVLNLESSDSGIWEFTYGSIPAVACTNNVVVTLENCYTDLTGLNSIAYVCDVPNCTLNFENIISISSTNGYVTYDGEIVGGVLYNNVARLRYDSAISVPFSDYTPDAGLPLGSVLAPGSFGVEFIESIAPGTSNAETAIVHFITGLPAGTQYQFTYHDGSDCTGNNHTVVTNIEPLGTSGTPPNWSGYNCYDDFLAAELADNPLFNLFNQLTGGPTSVGNWTVTTLPDSEIDQITLDASGAFQQGVADVGTDATFDFSLIPWDVGQLLSIEFSYLAIVQNSYYCVQCIPVESTWTVTIDKNCDGGSTNYNWNVYTPPVNYYQLPEVPPIADPYIIEDMFTTLITGGENCGYWKFYGDGFGMTSGGDITGLKVDGIAVGTGVFPNNVFTPLTNIGLGSGVLTRDANADFDFSAVAVEHYKFQYITGLGPNCFESVSVGVEITNPCSVSVVINDIGSDQFQAVASGCIGVVTYEWVGPNGKIYTTATISPDDGQGNYALEVTCPDGTSCTDVASFDWDCSQSDNQVNTTIVPTGTGQIQALLSNCTSETVTWTGTGISGSISGNPITPVASNGNYSATATCNDGVNNECNDLSIYDCNNNISVTQPTGTTLNVAVTLDNCGGSWSYSWTGPSGFSDTGATVNITESGDYYATATCDDDGCFVTGYINATYVQCEDSANITESPAGTLNANYVGTGTPVSYAWLPYGEVTSSITTSGAGTYSVDITIDDGCIYNAEYTVVDNFSSYGNNILFPLNLIGSSSISINRIVIDGTNVVSTPFTWNASFDVLSAPSLESDIATYYNIYGGYTDIDVDVSRPGFRVNIDGVSVYPDYVRVHEFGDTSNYIDVKFKPDDLNRNCTYNISGIITDANNKLTRVYSGHADFNTFPTDNQHPFYAAGLVNGFANGVDLNVSGDRFTLKTTMEAWFLANGYTGTVTVLTDEINITNCNCPISHIMITNSTATTVTGQESSFSACNI